MNINSLTDREFDALPLVVEGESKIVRSVDENLVVIKFKPTIYSFTANRSGVVPGSETLRLRATKLLIDVLRKADIDHAYLEINDRFVLAKRIVNPPPIEVVVKAFHSGTSKHRYYDMSAYPIRASHSFHAGHSISPEGGYPQPIVRFDWRNPMHHPKTGVRLADEVLGEEQADWFIDVAKARLTAKRVYAALSEFLGQRDVIIYDLCLFIDADGTTVFGEVSQDCGRFRHFSLGSLDKDEWRAGGSSEHVLSKWQMLIDIIEGPETVISR